MKTYWGNGGITPLILNFCTGWECSASLPGHLTPSVRDPGTQWTGAWMEP